MAFDDLASATESFINKSIEAGYALPHPADVERLHQLGNVITEDYKTTPKTPRKKSTPTTPKKKPQKDAKISNNDRNNNLTEGGLNIELSESESESEDSDVDFGQFATQKVGPAAGFSTTHYQISESDDSDRFIIDSSESSSENKNTENTSIDDDLVVTERSSQNDDELTDSQKRRKKHHRRQ
ncbi:hypothetical protein TRFO_33880 [Tritrichomonas foetus]|uniref:Uncharacterized protein n=1 Tax=Tritrichomonas foetus TaxID=1144522 RepID=A0A1J4JQ24_9EUKA|nr:hypothetical protein TRFO_33880 [Tritrichomonas foetus]|eukprot:OHS99619.1 hypothetical protein TRFO_33880 [Tritrichomonas foetus]